jgi:hypothetical protein
MTARPRLLAIQSPADSADLTAVGAFAASLGRVSWFTGVGQELTHGEAQEARDYLAALGLPLARLECVTGWRAAEAVVRDPRWNPAWWNTEERLRTRLLDTARRRWGEHPLMSTLTRVTDEATRVTFGAATVSAARDGVADPALARVAAGAATQAAYQAALARAAGEGDDHAFATKFRLFAAGRWLLGLVGETFYLF